MTANPGKIDAPSATSSSGYKRWDRRELADAIEQTRRSSTFQGIGPHPVNLHEQYWTMICEALRADTVSETGITDEEAAIKSLLSVVAYDMREAAENDLRALLYRVTCTEYTRGRCDGFDAAGGRSARGCPDARSATVEHGHTARPNEESAQDEAENASGLGARLEGSGRLPQRQEDSPPQEVTPQQFSVDESARWKEIQRLSHAVARKNAAPTDLESALCGAVVRAQKAIADLAAFKKLAAEWRDAHSRELAECRSAKLSPEVTAQATREEAARYRWLVDHHYGECLAEHFGSNALLLDALLDEEMKRGELYVSSSGK